MATIVLVHGAFHGGWCWKHVAGPLRDAGHEVFTPTLTGVSDRAHLLHHDIGLMTHVADVAAVLEAEELTDAVLVGHSYGGLVVTGAPALAPGRVRKVIHLDGYVGEPGKSGFDLSPPASVERFTAAANDPEGGGEGWTIPPYPPDVMGVTDPDDTAWIARRLTPHPLRGFTDPLDIPEDALDGIARGYILCTDPVIPTWIPMADHAKASDDWDYAEIACAHAVMFLKPDELVARIEEML